MEITKGIIGGAQKVVIYGPEGIGKSTFAACFPDPLFIDTEGSTKNLNVARLPRPGSFTMIMEQVKYVKSQPALCKTLVIDTADWAEQLVLAEVCDRYQKKGIEDFGYGKGYTYLTEDFGRFLNQLEDLIEIGINVVITAHATMRKFEQPDETGQYDRWELKLKKQTAPLLKEWADMILFANYKTLVIKDDKTDKAKARGGKRVMYTTHHACWDAKNRHGFPDEIPFEFQQIAACIPGGKSPAEPPKKDMKPTELERQKSEEPAKPTAEAAKPVQETVGGESKKLQESAGDLPEYFKPLLELMKVNKVTVQDIKEASTKYFPSTTPFENYPEEFVRGCWIGAWEKVFETVQKNWNGATPF